MTIIAFVGSVFSPYYRRALTRDPAAVDPVDHCAINVCLYTLDRSDGGARWTMTERGARRVQRSPTAFAVGPSSLAWRDGSLDITLRERACPLPRAVRGRVRVDAGALSRFTAALDLAGRHRWAPIAPCSRIEVDLDAPALRWQGNAYLDSNEGDEPIDRAFTRWDWLRASHADGSTSVIYDPQGPSVGLAPRVVAIRFHANGTTHPVDLGPEVQELARCRWWRIDRRVRALRPVTVLRTLEDTPFYARSLVRMRLEGEDAVAVHETLDARRLASPWVQRLLSFRMPRVA